MAHRHASCGATSHHGDVRDRVADAYPSLINWPRRARRAEKNSKDADANRDLTDPLVAKNLLKLRFCLVCHQEMTDEICCTCEMPTVVKTRA